MTHITKIEKKSENRKFQNQNDLVILCLDENKLDHDVKYEGKDKNNLYPHIYGPINLDAIVKVVEFRSNEDGIFSMPEEIVIRPY